MTPARKACLAIGISDAGGGLDYLGGALSAARGMHEWATTMGYESALLTDAQAPTVTVDGANASIWASIQTGAVGGPAAANAVGAWKPLAVMLSAR